MASVFSVILLDTGIKRMCSDMADLNNLRPTSCTMCDDDDDDDLI